MRDKLSFLAFAAVVLLLFSCASVSNGRRPDDDPFFRGLADRSWTLVEPLRAFGAENLYEEIDGEAELFLPYDFRDLRVAILSPRGNVAIQVRLEVFRHGDPREAYGIYSQHRFPGQETLALGPSEAIVSDASLDFFRGNTFVRIRQASPSASRRDLLSLGQAVMECLEGTGSPPPETQALRIRGLVPGTVVFQKRAVLGFEALAPGYEAKFSVGDVSGSLILRWKDGARSPAQSTETPSRRLPGFVRLEEGLYRANLPTGTIWLRESGDFLAGVAGKVSREQAKPLLDEMARNISSGQR